MRTSSSARAGGRQQVGGEAVGPRPRRLDVVEARGERGRLGRADPDRQAPGAVALLEQDDVEVSGVADVGDAHGDAGGHGWGLPSEVGEAGLQRGAGLVQAGLDGAHGDPEARRDLGVGEVGEVEEGDGVALAGRQAGDGGEHAVAQERFGVGGGGLRARGGSGAWAGGRRLRARLRPIPHSHAPKASSSRRPSRPVIAISTASWAASAEPRQARSSAARWRSTSAANASRSPARAAVTSAASGRAGMP